MFKIQKVTVKVTVEFVAVKCIHKNVSILQKKDSNVF